MVSYGECRADGRSIQECLSAVSDGAKRQMNKLLPSGMARGTKPQSKPRSHKKSSSLKSQFQAKKNIAKSRKVFNPNASVSRHTPRQNNLSTKSIRPRSARPNSAPRASTRSNSNKKIKRATTAPKSSVTQRALATPRLTATSRATAPLRAMTTQHTFPYGQSQSGDTSKQAIAHYLAKKNQNSVLSSAGSTASTHQSVFSSMNTNGQSNGAFFNPHTHNNLVQSSNVVDKAISARRASTGQGRIVNVTQKCSSCRSKN